MVNSTYGEKSVNRRLVYQWFQRFKEGNESLDVHARTGRPAIRTDANVRIVSDAIEEDQRVTIRDLSEQSGFSYGTVQRILNEDLKMRRVSASWVPRLLTEEQMVSRVKESRKFLRCYNREGEQFLRNVITVDETWLFYYDPETKMQSSQWKRDKSPPPKKARVTKTIGKHMFIVFFDMQGIILSHAVPKGQTVNATYYSKVKKT